MSTRPAIPSELRRRVLVEAGHRCAIPTCRHIEVDIHHIVPWEKCQEHKYENLIALCPNCHRRADKNDIDRKSLMLYKANLRFTHDKFTQHEVDILFTAYNLPSDRHIQMPKFMKFLFIRLIDAEYIEFKPYQGNVSVGGMSITPEALTITQKGKDFIDSLGIKEY